MDALLPPCRLEGLGSQAYGEEAIVSQFRQVPFEGADAADCISSSGHAAMFAGQSALFADVYDERILRIWRLGPGAPRDAEPALGVPFDTDLSQARRDVALRREDHPQLASEAIAAVRDVGYGLAHDWQEADGPPNWRTRPFLLRAFSNGTTGAALFAVHRFGPKEQRSLRLLLRCGPLRFRTRHLSRTEDHTRSCGRARCRRQTMADRVRMNDEPTIVLLPGNMCDERMWGRYSFRDLGPDYQISFAD